MQNFSWPLLRTMVSGHSEHLIFLTEFFLCAAPTGPRTVWSAPSPGCVRQAGGQLRGAAGVEPSGDCLARQVVLVLVLQPGHVEIIPGFICGVHVYWWTWKFFRFFHSVSVLSQRGRCPCASWAAPWPSAASPPRWCTRMVRRLSTWALWDPSSTSFAWSRLFDLKKSQLQSVHNWVSQKQIVLPRTD